MGTTRKPPDLDALCRKAAALAIKELSGIVSSSEEKTGDRITAAKTLIEFAKQSGDAHEAHTISIEGLQPEWLK